MLNQKSASYTTSALSHADSFRRLAHKTYKPSPICVPFGSPISITYIEGFPGPSYLRRTHENSPAGKLCSLRTTKADTDGDPSVQVLLSIGRTFFLSTSA